MPYSTEGLEPPVWNLKKNGDLKHEVTVFIYLTRITFYS